MAIPRAFASFFFFLFLVSPLYAMADNLIYSGGTLKSGESLIAGDYEFIMDEYCDLVLYHKGIQEWHSGTFRLDIDCYFSFDSNANLNVYGDDNSLLFQLDFDLDKGQYVLILEETGRLVIYGPHSWAWDGKLNGDFGHLFINSKVKSSAALPANKAAEKEAKAAHERISMVVNN
ncbi:alpha-D-mannose-specific plant lectins domain-containing protein [Dioscorea alata]|uniref:Alpha-D-mannose-specific plant lectins domain-containing protein n=1 Tax=Dioscorea alata TaxID=55571 RepID=A0ACB7WMC7_DIOAL|nr:alpha-D-mannose-specific plant lectins domain-containing protein [Dioscorea alata]